MLKDPKYLEQGRMKWHDDQDDDDDKNDDGYMFFVRMYPLFTPDRTNDLEVGGQDKTGNKGSTNRKIPG